jgi:hypothetical protein
VRTGIQATVEHRHRRNSGEVPTSREQEWVQDE